MTQVASYDSARFNVTELHSTASVGGACMAMCLAMAMAMYIYWQWVWLNHFNSNIRGIYTYIWLDRLVSSSQTCWVHAQPVTRHKTVQRCTCAVLQHAQILLPAIGSLFCQHEHREPVK